MKNRNTLKIGDTFDLNNTVLTVRASGWSKSEPDLTRTFKNKTYKVFSIVKNIVFFDAVNYTGGTPWTTTFEELERIGVLETQKTTIKIIGYRAPTDLFKGEVKKDDIYIVNGCNDKMFVPQTPRANTAAYYSVPTEIAETWLPVYEEEFKVGDYVVLTKHPTGWASEQPLGTVLKIENDKTKYCGGMMFTVSKNGKRMGGLDDGCYRKATQEEILATQTTTVTVSNHNIELTIYKNGAITSKKGSFSAEEVRNLYNGVKEAVLGSQVGTWSVYFVDAGSRFLRIGCSDDDFRVSLNELKTVIDAYDSLQ